MKGTAGRAQFRRRPQVQAESKPGIFDGWLPVNGTEIDPVAPGERNHDVLHFVGELVIVVACEGLRRPLDADGIGIGMRQEGRKAGRAVIFGHKLSSVVHAKHDHCRRPVGGLGTCSGRRTHQQQRSREK